MKNNSKASTLVIPLLIVACFSITILGTSFANNLEPDEGYVIKVDIINGKQDAYIKKVLGGSFSEIIDTDATFSNITCNTGELKYDEKTKTIYSDNIKEDTNCVLAFMEDGTKTISKSNLKSVNDNDGISYIYPGTANNNYLKINDTMFRIVRINGDNTYRLITDEDITKSTFGETNNYLNSNIKYILEQWIKTIKTENIVRKDYDITNYNELKENLINYEGFYINEVGLLSVNEANLIIEKNKNTYLDGNYYLANGKETTKSFAIINNKITNTKPDTELGIRPVINVNIKSLKGNGTKETPYIIEK